MSVGRTRLSAPGRRTSVTAPISDTPLIAPTATRVYSQVVTDAGR
jgi:hypothetical protein